MFWNLIGFSTVGLVFTIAFVVVWILQNIKYFVCDRNENKGHDWSNWRNLEIYNTQERSCRKCGIRQWR